MDIDRFKKVCVVGFKRSGVSLCQSLLSLGKKVRVSESAPKESFYTPLVEHYKNCGVEFEFGGHSKNFLQGCDLIIVSPGVNVKRSNVVGFALRGKIPIVGEVEFSSWISKAKIVAITGTNGKSTTAFLTYRVLQRKNPRTFLAGNIGIPFSSIAAKTKEGDIVVLEVSSFQLETIFDFKPYIACVINLEPDHMDRYTNFEEYIDAKSNVFRNQKETDYAVLNKHIRYKELFQERIRARIAFFNNEFENENYSAVYRIASLFGISRADCQKVFSEFQGLPHRLQYITRIKKVTFINDSKATNPSSTAWALKNISNPIILIAGGKDKGVEYAPVFPYLGKVKKINLFGEAKGKIKHILSSHSQGIELFSDMQRAVFSSFKEAQEGDVILFSPMCSSYDMFSNYRERGNNFIKIVRGLYAKIQ